ncbi:hypothetical protein [Actinophytocola gossypii]|uniref:Uncharacterized protein n=1 Tax=Actinophytocola gossypii TaxID=2812003 RepID=A0ABT2JJ64_9PSEU|nr:hypothetical protein [Actinophytocola gossypii]MCT2587924.1 hypothetical protein [Actinophytocola gossypii]
MGPLAISHDLFGRLRLADFLPPGTVERLDGWEYLDRYWIGEACGFTEWLRIESEPEEVRSIALDLAELPAGASAAMLATLRLPLRAGMTLPEITTVLGQPEHTEVFVPDRANHDFQVDTVGSYTVGCTVHEDDGLIYLTVHTTPLPE